MNFFIHQNIVIHSIKIDAMSNSSVFQIGSAGIIKSVSQLFNTGNFTEPAPETTGASNIPFIPLSEPRV